MNELKLKIKKEIQNNVISIQYKKVINNYLYFFIYLIFIIFIIYVFFYLKNNYFIILFVKGIPNK